MDNIIRMDTTVSSFVIVVVDLRRRCRERRRRRRAAEDSSPVVDSPAWVAMGARAAEVLDEIAGVEACARREGRRGSGAVTVKKVWL